MFGVVPTHGADCRTVRSYPTKCLWYGKDVHYFECSCGNKACPPPGRKALHDYRSTKAPMKRGEPELPLFSFDLLDLLARVRAEISELPPLRLEVWIQTQPALACIEKSSSQAIIRLHTVLNHTDTPEPVIAFILLHEMLHLVIPTMELEGRSTDHPPAFWEAECRLAPNRMFAWGWLMLELGQCLRRDDKRESTFVKSNWKHLMNERRSTMEEAALILNVRGQSEANGEPML